MDGLGRITATIGFAGLMALAQTSGAVAAPEQAAAKHFGNCTALNRVYPHGVGKKHAHDHVSGTGSPVTNFYRNNTLYAANKDKDRDGDHVACEKH